jgi:hypothetical protein
MERGTGLEPATICLEGRDSTTELPPLIPNKIPASSLRFCEFPASPHRSAGVIWSLGPGLNR